MTEEDRREPVRVAITQPYIPAYRYPLWDLVIRALERENVEARIFYGGDAEQLAVRARRGDGVDAEWAQQVETKTVSLGRRFPKVIHRRLPKEWSRRGTLLLTEMQVTNANAWAARFRGQKYITLGHGKSYTSASNRLSDAFENTLNRRASHVLTYTPGGRQAVMTRTGLTADRVSSFNNSTDTVALRKALSEVSEQQVAEFRSVHGIPPAAKVALFVGALNVHKRLDLLTAAAEIVFARTDDWWLVVAGDGDQADRIETLAARSGRVIMLGQATPEQYAPAAKISSLLVNPGRVGLVAVDALTMSLPVLTTSVAMHAPEAEYLTPGVNVIETDGTAEALAQAWMAFPRDAHSQEQIVPTIEDAAAIISRTVLDTIARVGSRP